MGFLTVQNSLISIKTAKTKPNQLFVQRRRTEIFIFLGDFHHGPSERLKQNPFEVGRSRPPGPPGGHGQKQRRCLGLFTADLGGRGKRGKPEGKGGENGKRFPFFFLGGRCCVESHFLKMIVTLIHQILEIKWLRRPFSFCETALGSGSSVAK